MSTIENEDLSEEVDALSSPPALLEDPDELAELEAEQEIVRLSGKQKILVGLTVFVCFIIFGIWFLPKGTIVRWAAKKYFKGGTIDFADLSMSPFGSDSIQDLNVKLRGDYAVSAARLTSSVGYYGVWMNDKVNGDLSANSLQLSLKDLDISTKTANIQVNLENIMKDAREWKGRFRLSTGKLEMSSLPLPAAAVAFLGNLDPAEVKPRNLKLAADLRGGGNIRLNGSLVTDYFPQITAKGTATVNKSILEPNLDVDLCLKPAADLNQKNKAVFDAYSLFAAAGGELCIKLTGVPGTAGFKPSLPAGGPKPGGTTPTPTPTPTPNSNPTPGGDSGGGGGSDTPGGSTNDKSNSTTPLKDVGKET